MDYNQKTAEKLLEQIMTGPASPDAGSLANDLLRQFHRGFPLENLRRLLLSRNQDLAGIGVWIASELGAKGKPLLGDIISMLAHPAKKVRFFAIDCVLVWADQSNAVELASAIKLLNDPESAVRWKAMNFLALATRAQLQGALSYLQDAEPKARIVSGLRWLLGSDATSPEVVMATLKAPDSLLRKYAAVAAARLSATDSGPLSCAASVTDPDVKDFANSRIEATAGGSGGWANL